MSTDTYVITTSGSPPVTKAVILKDPDATLDYTFDWTAYLALYGDSLSSVSWVLSSGLTKTTGSFTSTVATVWLSGGVLGNVETCTCHITTAAGRIDDRTINLKMVEK